MTSRIENILRAMLDNASYTAPPQSRVEAILLAIKNGTAYADLPQSRIEALLLAIKNDTAYADLPQSRIEAILLAKRNVTAYAAPPQSRIEALLLEWLGSTVLEGIQPLTFLSGGEALSDYAIDGSTGGVGDYDDETERYLVPITVTGKNLLENNCLSERYSGLTITVNADRSITISGTATETVTLAVYDGSHGLYPSAYQPIDTGVYVLSGSHPDAEVGKYSVSYRYTSAIGVPSKLGRIPTGGVTLDNTDGKYHFLAVYIAVWKDAVLDGVTFKPMLRKAGTADGYEKPYKHTVTLSLEEPLDAGGSVTLADTGVNIPTHKGINTLTVDTAVQPGKITIQGNIKATGG